MLTKDCHVKIAIFFFTTFPLAVLFSDVVLYGLPLFFVFLHLVYGFLMYLIVEIIRRRRGIDCNATGLGVVYVAIFYVLSFREITLFGLGYLIFAIAFVLISLFAVLRINQPETSPQRR
jgi:hypothetical protein